MLDGGNVLSWLAQGLILAPFGALLPSLFRIRHPRTQLIYCRAVLVFCLLLPVLQPWRHPVWENAQIPDGVPGARTPRATELPRVGRGLAAQRDKHAEAIYPAAGRTGRAAAQFPWGKASWSRLILWILAAGAAVRLCWLMGGLWQARKRRIAAMPLFPIPDSIQAACSVTHADAVFCISHDSPGPVTLGWLAPVVLLPESFLSLAEEAQCCIACHELLHVRRHDWLVTVLEELAGVLLWFNPGAWMLLAQTRLAREQLVDAEAVLLTAEPEPYIRALLAIAGGRPVFDLAPAPIPLFLRRRHLTQRIHALLKEASMSKLRLLSTYSTIAALLALAGWFAFATFPLVGNAQAQPGRLAAAALTAEPAGAPSQLRQNSAAGRSEMSMVASVPVPPDPYELAAARVQVASAPADRAAALGLLERARQNSKLHMPGTPPYQIQVSLTAAGDSAYVGSGELTETWLSGQVWRWTAKLGGVLTGANRFVPTNAGGQACHGGSLADTYAAKRDFLGGRKCSLERANPNRSSAVEWQAGYMRAGFRSFRTGGSSPGAPLGRGGILY